MMIRPVSFLAALLMAAPALAQSKTMAPPPPHTSSTTGQTVTDIIFSEVEKKIIKDYFGIETAAKKESDKDDDDKKGKKDKDKKDKDKGKDKDKDEDKGDKHESKGKSDKLPPGLAKRDHLPPGLAKRSTLPPGLAKRDLPEDLLAKLPKPPEGTERAIVDNEVVLIETATGMVLDVLADVIAGASQ